jgi:taurine--2-oxoglutarate transaminase
VRGRGVFWAVELVADRASRAPLPAADMARLKKDLLARGLLPFVQDNRIHVVPPLVVSADEIARGVGIIDEALAAL